jgi:glyoxylase-like metal-dependent hydrolase (beta-lactamase superfamily II)
MFMKTLPAYRTCAIVLLAMAAALAGSAQDHRATELPGKRADDTTLTAELVRTGLYMISGGGGNSMLRLSANGLILVDGKLPGNYDALRAKVRKISDQPIRALILTDHEESHIGTNTKFLQAGTAIVVQENAKTRLPSYTLSDGKAAPPIVSYDREYKIRLGGVEAQLMHFGNAYTNGDTVVYFPLLKVVAVGALFASTPIPDYSTGGSLVGWGPVVDKVLKLDFDVVVPGAGPPLIRADLEAFKTKIDTLVSRATGLVKRGVPKDQLMAQLKTDDLGFQLTFTGDQLDHFFAELSSTK